MRAVREDEEGIDMEFLQRGLRESDEKEDKVGNKRPVGFVGKVWAGILAQLGIRNSSFRDRRARFTVI